MVTSSSVHIINQLFDIGREIVKAEDLWLLPAYCNVQGYLLTDKFLYGKKARGFSWWHFRCKMPGI